jgi:indolepyruvate ferredoxin oxidoreductase beta subunit
MSYAPPIRILIAALGGEGGGVLLGWIVSAAQAAGMKVQATSVPGVAQRTGSTSYYVEIADPSSDAVLSLVPMPARVDVVVASELVEAARCMAAGFVSPTLTTLIASTNRVFSTAEKINLGDGRYAAEDVINTAQQMARNCHLADFDALATQADTFISATLYGGLIGSGVLPWSEEISLSVLGQGRSAEASLRGVRAAISAVTAPVEDLIPDQKPQSPQHMVGLPPETQEIVAHGFDRVVDFQDAAYGQAYLDHVGSLLAATQVADHRAVYALTEAARRLALWMAYEDVARVADLKTRPERFKRIHDEAQAKPGQIVWVTEYMKPRAEEIADSMPVGLGRWIMRRVDAGKGLPFLGRGVFIRSNGMFGYRMLRLVAALRHLRRRSLRFQTEMAEIARWVEAMTQALTRDPAFASGLAELPRVLKGYSDTHLRGKLAYAKIMDGIVAPAIAQGTERETAQTLRHAVAAALADEAHTELDAILRGGDAADPAIPNLRGASHAH